MEGVEAVSRSSPNGWVIEERNERIRGKSCLIVRGTLETFISYDEGKIFGYPV